MLDTFRYGLGVAAALRAARRRSPPTPGARPEGRRVLAVLPPEAGRAVWALLKRIDLPARQLRLVALGTASPPDAFAGAVEVLSSRDWRGLAPRADAQRSWGFQPDVALNLAAPDDPAALLLVGAAPASVRLAAHAPRTEAAYDLQLSGPPGAPDPDAVADLLARLSPPVLPLR